MPDDGRTQHEPSAARPANDPDPVRRFETERARHVSDLARDADLRALSLRWMMHSSQHKYTYNFTWLGRPIIQFPQDLLAAQEIIWRTRPDLVIETGIAHGGSLVYWASLLQLLGGERRVIGIDIDLRPHNRSAILGHPLGPLITLLDGSSVDEHLAARVAALADRYDRRMVILDSHHAHDHVLRELQLYGPLVTPGCYLIVFDTVIQDLPPGFLADARWDNGNNPKTAVHEYLATTGRFEIDRDIPAKLMITAAPDGYLRCVRP
ncbi:MAG: cephalosporin hydroxylase family protein [Planctomycetota bacterium]|nr:cephalosporin hydroxylase family protein [Planctomycetota bacterium]